MVVTLLLAAASMQPGMLKTFKDWTVGCDNGRGCQAVALIPEDYPDGAVTMKLSRGPAASAVPEIGFAGEPRGVVAIAVDGKRVAVRLATIAEQLRVAPADAAAFAAAIPNAQKIELLDRAGKPVGTVSAAGASAALRYIDDAQKRVGTVTALVAKGPATAMPAPPPLPVVVRPPMSATRPAKFRAAEARKYNGDDGCGVSAADFRPEAHRLDATHTLVMVPAICGNGAYNYFSTAVIAGNTLGPVAVAKFDANSGMSAELSADASLVNAAWDDAKRLLTTFSKGRGLGDCGTTQSFAWDGGQFRLIEQTDMDACRGSIDYITTWRATVR